MTDFPEDAQLCFRWFWLVVGPSNAHFFPFSLRPQHKVVQFGLRTETDGRGGVGLKSSRHRLATAVVWLVLSLLGKNS